MRTPFSPILLTLALLGQTLARKHHKRVSETSKTCKVRPTSDTGVVNAVQNGGNTAVQAESKVTDIVAVEVSVGSISSTHHHTRTRTHTTTITASSIPTTIMGSTASQATVGQTSSDAVSSMAQISPPGKVVDSKPTSQTQLLTAPTTPSIMTAPASQPSAQPSSSSIPPSLIPSTYASPKFLQPRSQILSHSSTSFQNLLTLTKEFTAFSGWTIAVGFHAIALQDQLMGTKTYEKVLAGMNPAWGGCGWKVEGVDCYNDDAGWAGLADVQAWESYGGDYLDKGVAVWQFITDHGLLTQGVLDSGAIPGVKDASVKMSKECNGKSMLGGVFWQNGSPENLSAMKNVGIASVSTGNYALLSAELCRVTKNTTYCDYAVKSQGFLDTHLYRNDGLINDGINSNDCKMTGGPRSYTTGLYLQTAAILGNLLSSSTYTSLSKQAVLASISQRDFTASTGIINEADGDPMGTGDLLTFKAVFIRSLVNAHQYMGEETQEAIRGFTNLQYWSMATKDSDDAGKPGWYGRNWAGPYQGYTAQSQIDALDVLNGLMLNPESAFPTSGGENGPVMGL